MPPFDGEEKDDGGKGEAAVEDFPRVFGKVNLGFEDEGIEGVLERTDRAPAHLEEEFLGNQVGEESPQRGEQFQQVWGKSAVSLMASRL